MSGGFFNKFLNLVGLEDEEGYEDEMRDEDEYFEEEDMMDEEYIEDSPKKDKKRGKVVGLPVATNGRMRVVVYQPKSNEDTQNIIDNLRSRKPVVINLDELDIEVAQRALDFVSGAVYALSANIQKVARSIYVVTPSGVDIATNEPDRAEENYSVRSARR